MVGQQVAHSTHYEDSVPASPYSELVHDMARLAEQELETIRRLSHAEAQLVSKICSMPIWGEGIPC